MEIPTRAPYQVPGIREFCGIPHRSTLSSARHPPKRFWPLAHLGPIPEMVGVGEEFAVDCEDCGMNITMESLCTEKFRKDIKSQTEGGESAKMSLSGSTKPKDESTLIISESHFSTQTAQPISTSLHRHRLTSSIPYTLLS